jgi:hypothetical protein
VLPASASASETARLPLNDVDLTATAPGDQHTWFAPAEPRVPQPPAPEPPAPEPPPPQKPKVQPAAELIDPDHSTPFSSSTLAELYYQQGLVDRAVDVYRQLLQQEPSNERARLRLVELEAPGATVPEPAAPSDERTARRRALERTIAGLETLLAAVQRKGA